LWMLDEVRIYAASSASIGGTGDESRRVRQADQKRFDRPAVLTIARDWPTPP
jgi:hypothetical protein